MLEKEQEKNKLNKDYSNKLPVLLYNNPKYKNYSNKKRRIINNIRIKYNDKNKFLINLKKFHKKIFPHFNTNLINGEMKTRNLNNETNITRNIKSFNNNLSSENSKQKLFLSPNSINSSLENEKMKNSITTDNKNNYDNDNFYELTDYVKNILYNNDEEISLDVQKKIYNNLKKKFYYSRNKINNQSYFPFFNTDKESKYALNNQFLSEIPKPKNNLKRDKNPFDMNKFINNFNKLKQLKDEIKLNKDILSKDKILELIKKESSSVSPIKNFKKKLILLPYEMFNYDAKKWGKNKKSKNEIQKEKHFNEINRDIDEKIKNMKNKVIALNQEIFKLEDVRYKLKSQKKLIAVKSKSFKNYKSQFSSINVKARKKMSKIDLNFN